MNVFQIGYVWQEPKSHIVDLGMQFFNCPRMLFKIEIQAKIICRRIYINGKIQTIGNLRFYTIMGRASSNH